MKRACEILSGLALVWLMGESCFAQLIPIPTYLIEPNYTPVGVTFDLKDYDPFVNNVRLDQTFNGVGDKVESKTKVWIYLPRGQYWVRGRLRVQRKDEEGWRQLGDAFDLGPNLVASNGRWVSVSLAAGTTVAELKLHRTLVVLSVVNTGNGEDVVKPIAHLFAPELPDGDETGGPGTGN